MKLVKLRLENFRSIKDTGFIELGNVSILVGRNNSGKSSILHSIYGLQAGGDWNTPVDVRQHAEYGLLTLQFRDIGWDEAKKLGLPSAGDYNLLLQGARGGNQDRSFHMVDFPDRHSFSGFTYTAPDAYIYPFFTRKKATSYQEQIGSVANNVMSDWSFLSAKLDQLIDREHPYHEVYHSTCKEVLGFVVTAVPSGAGKRPGIITGPSEYILLEQLGAGVANIVTLLVNLVTVQGKLFLIEEPENDLHPAALKALLEVIAKSANNNQFIISTHNHVVLRFLSALEDSRLYKVHMEFVNRLPLSAVSEVESDDFDGRENLLKELGYELSDFDFWNGWLIFEEASAEAIIRDVLIPFFTPQLRTFRTVSGGGVDRAGLIFDEYVRLFLYLHLEPRYKNRAWLIVDGDAAGRNVANKMAQKYTTWSSSNFIHLSAENIEEYYPTRFHSEIEQIKNESEPTKKRELKKNLAIEAHNWSIDNSKDARVAWEESAAPLIKILLEIQVKHLEDR